MVCNYSCLRKYVVVLMMIGGMGQSLSLLGSKYQPRYVESDRARKFLGIDSNEKVTVYDRGTDANWSSSAWQVVNSPYFVMAVNLVLPVIVVSADTIRIHYWLTDEQREQALQKLSKEKQERKIFVEFQKLALSEESDAKLMRQQQLRENEILLARAELENRGSKIEHLKKMIQNASPEKRAEMQEQLDVCINEEFKVCLEKVMGN